MMSVEFDDAQFRAAVTKALEEVRKVLDNTRLPQYAPAVAHEYSDKFVLAEFLTQSAIAAVVAALEQLGLTPEKLLVCQAMAANRSVTLRLQATETCKVPPPLYLRGC
jgi:uncharacterized membrane protein YgcG